MRHLRQLSPEELTAAYRDVFTEAFPPEELKPLSSMEDMIRDGVYRALGLFDQQEALGYICLWWEENYILIDYLCVPHTRRNDGIGSELIRRTLEAYPKESVFIGEVEAPTGDAEADAIIYRRLGFYARSGAVTLGYDSALFGVHYKTIAWSSSPLDEAEVLRHHHSIYKKHFSPAAFAAHIQIPLHPGEAIYPRKQWEQ